MVKFVTVIIPTIGRPEYLRASVESVLNQSYCNIELLISDNVPDISSKSLLSDVVDARIRIIERDQRYGFCEHMNMCIADSLGYYMMILSDDDVISPDYVSSMVELFESRDDVTVGLGRQNVLEESECRVLSEQVDKTNTYIDGFEYSVLALQGKLGASVLTYISLFAKKEDVIYAGGFRNYPDGSHSDNYLFYSLAAKGVVGLSGASMGYRVYLSSSGLSTPFEKLLSATVKYDNDISTMVFGLKGRSFFSKIYVRYLFKISSVRMLINRSFSVYKKRDSSFLLFKYLIMSVFFAMSFIRRD